MEAYLSRDQPRWSPKSEKEIRAAADSGVIGESHHIDVKRETGNSANARKETAKDLASFGIDGGALLIGVEEDKPNRNFSLAPQPLDGLIEKIDQIAAMAIDPPLTVISIEIVSEADPRTGYVLVHIPPSPIAPHMVDGRYYARAERTRRILSDAEILRLHTQRESLEAQADRLLDIEIKRDPVESARKLGHLYLVAQPVSAPRRLAHELVRRDADAVYELVLHTPLALSSERIADLEPSPAGHATTHAIRANGVALCSDALGGAGRTLAAHDGHPAPDNGRLLDIEIREDGGVRILVGKMTAPISPTGTDALAVMEGLAVAYAHRLINWAIKIGERTGWRGSWILGLHGDGLRGLGSYLFRPNLGYIPKFDEPDFREITTASHLEMVQRPGGVAYRLVGRLTESLGTWDRFKEDLTDPLAKDEGA